jgi:putative two-component system response regulator
VPEHVTVKERVLIIDDDDQSLRLIDRILSDWGFRCTMAASIAAARECLATTPFDLMLCDVELPDGSGLDLVEYALERHPRIAALMVSGLDEVEIADRALAIGAYGYLVKPFTANDVLRGVLNTASRLKHDLDAEEDLKALSEETIQRLCIAVEAWDPATAAHISRMSEYCGQIALEMGYSQSRADLISTAAAMHDIGKIGIPDAIVHKPGPLTRKQRAVMQTHTEIGYRILAGSRSELVRLAALIAWTHHERFDGTGYPRGLSGLEISIEGRIAAVADVFDALTRDRVYRPRFASGEARAMVEAGRGTQFDPDVVDALIAVLDRSAAAASPSPSKSRDAAI